MDKVSKLEEEQLDNVQGGSLLAVGAIVGFLGAGVAAGIGAALGLFKKRG